MNGRAQPTAELHGEEAGRATSLARPGVGWTPWSSPLAWSVGVVVALAWSPVLWRLAGTGRETYRVLGINDYPLHVDIAARFSLDPTQVEAPHLLYHLVTAVLAPLAGAGAAPAVTVVLASLLTYLAVTRLLVEPSADGRSLLPGAAMLLAAIYFFVETPTLVLLAIGAVDPTTPYQTVHWWGNPTWLVALPLSLMTLPLLHEVVQRSDGESPARPAARWSLLAVVVLGALAKPTLTLVLIPALPIHLAVRRSPVRNHIEALRWVIVPAVVVIAVQTWFLGSGRSEAFDSSLVFDPIVTPVGWERMGPLFAVPVLLPLAAMALTRGRFIREPNVSLVLTCTGVAFLIMTTLREVDGRAAHGNMAVPMQMCVALLVLLSIRSLALVAGRAARGTADGRRSSRWTLGVLAVLLVAFLAGGVLSYLDAVGALAVPTDWILLQ